MVERVSCSSHLQFRACGLTGWGELHVYIGVMECV